MQALGPAPAGHGAAGELVDDDDLTVADDIFHVLVEEDVGAQGGVDMVHEHDVGGVVKALAFAEQAKLSQHLLDVLVTLLAEKGLTGLFVHRIVARAKVRLALFIGDGGLAGQARDDAVDFLVEVGIALGGTGDDQRGAGLVDEDGVHLVDDGVVGITLHPLLRGEGHVVPQVVEAELVVGAVGNIGGVGLATRDVAQMPIALTGRRLVVIVDDIGGGVRAHAPGGVDDAHRQAEELVDAPHPHRVATGQVIVDRHQVDALARQGIEVDRQGRYQGLAFASPHLGDAAVVEDHAADELDVEMAHAEGALASLADHGEGLLEQIVQAGSGRQAIPELGGLGTECHVRKLGHLRLQGGDLGDHLGHLLHQPVVAATEDLFEQIRDHVRRNVRSRQRLNHDTSSRRSRRIAMKLSVAYRSRAPPGFSRGPPTVKAAPALSRFLGDIAGTGSARGLGRHRPAPRADERSGGAGKPSRVLPGEVEAGQPQRIDGDSLLEDLEVEVGAGGTTTAAQSGDDLALGHQIPRLHQQFLAVCITGDHAIGMPDLDQAAIAVNSLALDHQPISDSQDVGADLARVVDAAVKTSATMDRILPHPEVGGNIASSYGKSRAQVILAKFPFHHRLVKKPEFPAPILNLPPQAGHLQGEFLTGRRERLQRFWATLGWGMLKVEFLGAEIGLFDQAFAEGIEAQDFCLHLTEPEAQGIQFASGWQVLPKQLVVGPLCQ